MCSLCGMWWSLKKRSLWGCEQQWLWTLLPLGSDPSQRGIPTPENQSTSWPHTGELQRSALLCRVRDFSLAFTPPPFPTIEEYTQYLPVGGNESSQFLVQLRFAMHLLSGLFPLSFFLPSFVCECLMTRCCHLIPISAVRGSCPHS